MFLQLVLRRRSTAVVAKATAAATHAANDISSKIIFQVLEAPWLAR